MIKNHDIIKNKDKNPTDTGESMTMLSENLQGLRSDVLMLTQDSYYRQKDGLAMGSPPAPPPANGWLYMYDPRIDDSRYMVDIIRTILDDSSDQRL